MNPRPQADFIHFEMPDHVDMIAIERRARELRAQAFADLLRSMARAVQRRIAAIRPAAGSRTA